MIYAIGDIHGELAKLDAVLAQITLTSDDTIVFIGDYVDRGPDSFGVINRVRELQESWNVVTLRGNHEQMMLDAREYYTGTPKGKSLDTDFALMWFHNGADRTLASYPKNGAPHWYERIPEDHWRFLENTEMERTIGPYRFVHAGVLPMGVKWEDPALDPRLWIREPFLLSKENFGHVVVFGHTPLRQPLIEANKIGIDTGAAYGRQLTAVSLDPGRPYGVADVRVIQS